jgi:pheromone shutdown protein TraB
MHVHSEESVNTAITRNRAMLTHSFSLAPICVGSFSSLMAPCSITEALSVVLAFSSSWHSIVNPYFLVTMFMERI